MPKPKETKVTNFEKSLQELEDIVSQMEKGDLSLEDSLEHFERGIKLSRECQQALRNAEQKISVLSKENDEWVEKSFDDGKQPADD